MLICFFFFSSRRRHTRLVSDWSSDVCSSDLHAGLRRRRHLLRLRTALGNGGDAGLPARGGGGGAAVLHAAVALARARREIGRASCRERGRTRGWSSEGKEESRGDSEEASRLG